MHIIAESMGSTLEPRKDLGVKYVEVFSTSLYRKMEMQEREQRIPCVKWGVLLF